MLPPSREKSTSSLTGFRRVSKNRPRVEKIQSYVKSCAVEPEKVAVEREKFLMIGAGETHFEFLEIEEKKPRR